MKHLRIGTRGSLLAKWQAEFVRKQIFQATGIEGEIIIIKTTGDKMQQSSLSQIGGKGIFIKELEDALLDESIDIAVHSVKDIPTEVPPGMSFPAICRREDVRDCLVSGNGATLASLRQGARVGTGSLRRQAQLRHIRPDLDVRDLRGNVDTRLRKVEAGEYDAVMLAKAGLDRLGWTHRISETLSPDVCMPAVGQGATRHRMPRFRRRNLRRPRETQRRRDSLRHRRRTHACSPSFRAAARFRSALGPASSATNWFSTPAYAPSTDFNTSSSAPPHRPIRPAPSANAWPTF